MKPKKEPDKMMIVAAAFGVMIFLVFMSLREVTTTARKIHKDQHEMLMIMKATTKASTQPKQQVFP